jgi:alkylhydroperoxidase/carboxymuconolactone decarboxylase family protein YurZ
VVPPRGEKLAGGRLLKGAATSAAAAGALVAIGSPAVCLEWAVSRVLAAGATEDEITDVLLAVPAAAGLGRVVGATVGVADGLGYDVQAALLDPDDR